ncbi:MAG: M48 family metalloprotease [Shimia sp.]
MRLLLTLLLICAASLTQAKSLLRDAGMERALRELSRPILTAAGLSAERVRILVVNDSSLNAFVVSHDAIFLHSGLIMKLESAEQLQAVIAHEAAHIANGHISRRITNMRSAQNAAAVGMLLSGLAVAAGADARAAAGAGVGLAESAQRQMLAHTRAEEASADQATIRYLLTAGVDPIGAVEVMDYFRGQEALSVGRQDPYARSHPMSADRYRALKALVDANRRNVGPNAASNYWFARAQGILTAFNRAPSWTLRRATSGSDIDTMRRAVAHHRAPDRRRAIAEMQRLVALRPNDPYYRDLQGQILLENREFAAAVQAYRAAVQLAPGDAQILGGYGRALVALDTPQATAEAIRVLSKARTRDALDARVLRDLGLAYARAGQPGMAAVTGAERLALIGRLPDAKTLARRAAGQLPTGSPAWRRAQDILNTPDPRRR